MYIGVDCGTQSTKVVVVDIERGMILAEASRAHRLDEAENGRREQAPAEWLAALKGAFFAALDKAGAASPGGDGDDIVLDLREGAIDLQRISALRERIGTDGGRIIGLGDRSDLKDYRQLKRHGCDEYLPSHKVCHGQACCRDGERLKAVQGCVCIALPWTCAH